MKSEAHVPTALPGRYMRQLCNHFAHKIPASYTEESGRIEFPFGICTLQIGADLLILRAEADEEDKLRQLEDVIARHLERFAWRDKPEIAWSPAGDDT